MPIYPLKFKPLYKARLWGGRRLETVFGKPLPPGEKIGESWELADLPEDKTLIANGPLAGLTLGSAVQREGKALTGAPSLPSPFPLLIKFLDCSDVLSVQVHPDEAACRRLGKGDIKYECWYVIQSDVGAVIYKGLREGVTREQFESALAAGSVEETLRRVPVCAGECHMLPAGTPHALGGGLLIAEIQTPSDTTYRVFDWNRRDERGLPRPLHIPEALESIHFDASGDDLSVKTEGIIADCPYFRIEKKHSIAGRPERVEGGWLRVFVIISGEGELTGSGSSVPLRAGDTLLVPSMCEGRLVVCPGGEYLSVTIPPFSIPPRHNSVESLL
jgi:mannose-6-phosphate isomerase